MASAEHERDLFRVSDVRFTSFFRLERNLLCWHLSMHSIVIGYSVEMLNFVILRVLFCFLFGIKARETNIEIWESDIKVIT